MSLTQATATFIGRMLTALFKLILWLSLLAILIFSVPPIRQTVLPYIDQTISQITHLRQYHQLLQQDLPTENSLPNPLPSRHLTDTWGAARSGGRKHEGIDIFAPRGTPIHATTHGIVRKVGIDRLGGNVVSIIGPGGAGHYYAHLEEYGDIREGDWVEQGDIIGYVGDSGNAKGTPTHVHYGIYIQGKAVNPYPLLIKSS
ncbi:M23 family metallopeptidase [Psychrobacter sp. I-STPA6b]|uniref:M23 family metallopeptidase n=1 Tax=Psychrobacter sp. I-STPA6b TaxID=2585718 RepID=UPI001D0C7BCF|nr:M23 family metallopeptidase [Psychrobacter sp. I-STPA6b]